MIELSAEAAQQVCDLRAGYEAKERQEAIRNLIAAVIASAERIERAPGVGLPTPPPYPELAREGRLWLKEGRYWIAYSTVSPPVILAVFHEAADIPGRS